MSSADGHVAGTTTVVDNGPDGARWNLVLVGDGYREPELPTYAADVDRFVALLRVTAPFDACFAAINIHRVDVVSAESGADDPVACDGTGAAPNTYFDATFCSVGPGGVRIPRLLTVHAGRALATATARVRARHQVVCLVNSAQYGGSGGVVAVASTHPSAAEIALHELGHSAFGLADEYGGDGTGTPAGEPPEPNVTRVTDRDTVKWRALVAPGTPMPSACDAGCTGSGCVPPPVPPPDGAVGAYEGGLYSDCGTYRPLPDCRMRTLGRPYCPVCAAAVQEALAPFLPGGPAAA